MDASSPLVATLLNLDRSPFALINGTDGLPLSDAAMRLLSFVSSSRAAWLWLLLLALAGPRAAIGESARGRHGS
jgi:hypothetical protein